MTHANATSPSTPETVRDSSARSSQRLRWAVPAAVALAVGAAFAIPTLASANGEALPETTPTQLLADLAEAEPFAMSGTAIYTARLGLPEIPAEMTGGADPLNLISGSSTIRVWTDGLERSRASLLGATSEYSVVVDGLEGWTYSSAKNEVTHISLDEAAQAAVAANEAEHKAALEAEDVPTPIEFAEQVLADADEHSEVTLGSDIVVAGRDAYQLVLTPRTSETLVAKIVVAIDGETLLPLSVQTWSTQDSQSPALELAFTDVSMTAPSDAALAFSTPAGATVTEKVIAGADLEGTDDASAMPAQLPDGATPPLPEGVTLTGEGWATIVEREGVDVAALIAGDPAAVDAELADSPWAGRPAEDLAEEFKGDGSGFSIDSSALYNQLTTQVDGGRLLTSALLSVLVTDDGRVFVGAVPTDALLAAAGLSGDA